MVEEMRLKQEGLRFIENKLKAQQACLFLPDYLMTETVNLNDEESMDVDIHNEFEPSTMYFD